MARIIKHIALGVVDGKPAWIFEYADGERESYQLDIATARQFYQGLQEVVLMCETRQMARDRVRLADSVQMRLEGEGDEQ